MPIIYNPSSVGGAGTAMSAVTEQSNQYIQQLLALTQLQDRRKVANRELDQRERAFAAELEQSNTLMDFRERAFASEEERAEALLAMRAKEMELQLRDQERLERIADAQIAADEARVRSAGLTEALGYSGMASKVSTALGGKYPVSSQGLLGMVSAASAYDKEHGTNFAKAFEAEINLLTGGEYAGLEATEIPGRLNADKRLPLVYTAIGEKLHGLMQKERAVERAGEVTARVSSLGKRIEATGDVSMAREYAASMLQLLPQEDELDDSFLQYADGDFREDIMAWEKRVGLRETKNAVQALLDTKRKGLSQERLGETMGMGASAKTLNELIGSAMQGIEAADSQDDAWAAYLGVLPLIDPSAKAMQEYALRQSLGFGGVGGAQQRSGVAPDSRFIDGESVYTRFFAINKESQDMALSALGEFGYDDWDEVEAAAARDPQEAAKIEATIDRVSRRIYADYESASRERARQEAVQNTMSKAGGHL